MPRRLPRTRGVVSLALAAALLLLAVPIGPSHAAETVDVAGRLAGRTFPAGAGDPIRLSPKGPTPLELTITNQSRETVEVRTISLNGRVIGLTFFSYQTSVGIIVPPGTAVTREFSLDLAGLEYQATGLFNAEISLLDAERRSLGSSPTAVDVRGSWRSVYVVFGLVLAAGTIASFVRAVRDLARHKLSPNRWRRGLRFLIPGIGLGLTLIFTSSAFRLFLVGRNSWLPILLVSAAALFAVGYLTPNPDDDVDAPMDTRRWEYAEPPGEPLS